MNSTSLIKVATLKQIFHYTEERKVNPLITSRTSDVQFNHQTTCKLFKRTTIKVSRILIRSATATSAQNVVLWPFDLTLCAWKAQIQQ